MSNSNENQPLSTPLLSQKVDFACGCPINDDKPEPLKRPLSDKEKLVFQSHANAGPVLIFDGFCNLCNGAMRWYAPRLPSKSKMGFMWLQHPLAQQVIEKRKIENIEKSWAFIDENSVLHRGSTAWLRALTYLDSCIYRYFAGVVLILCPECIREPIYLFISKNRYSWLGRTKLEDTKDEDKIPEELKSRMLHELEVR